MAEVQFQPQTIDAAIEPGSLLRRGNSLVQDVVSVAELDNDVTVLGVYDGHGPNGLEYAQCTASVLDKALLEFAPQQPSAMSLNAQYAARIGAIITGKLANYGGFDGWLGGNTVTMAVAHRNLVSTVQLGDGGIVFLPDDRRSPAQRLTPAHDAHNPAEVARAQAAGATLEETGHFMAPEGIGGLRITRAVGDNDFSFVSHKPEISHSMVREPGTLVVASDGLWTPTTLSNVDGPLRDTLTGFMALCDRPDTTLRPDWLHRKAALLSRFGNSISHDDAGVITADYR